jgi:gliding motility-associated-like protein
VNPVIVPVLNFTYPTVCVNGGVNPAPVLGAGFTTGGTFSSTSGVTIDPTTGVIDLSTTTPGTYTVTYSVTGSNAVGICTGSGTNTASITINVIPTITVSAEQTIWIGTSATVVATGGSSYAWSPPQGITSCFNASCDSISVSPDFTTIYCVVVTDANGCKDSTCSKVRIETPCPSNRDLVVPNAFTPNGDGNNDELCLNGWDDCVTAFQIYIYDRWGEKVFESDSPHFCWDGMYKGKALDPAVFVYFIKASYLTAGATINDAKGILDITKKGNISLVR